MHNFAQCIILLNTQNHYRAALRPAHFSSTRCHHHHLEWVLWFTCVCMSASVSVCQRLIIKCVIKNVKTFSFFDRFFLSLTLPLSLLFRFVVRRCCLRHYLLLWRFRGVCRANCVDVKSCEQCCQMTVSV